MTGGSSGVERLEAFLARLYTDAAARAAFLEDPLGEALRAGLAPDDAASMAAVDRVGLDLAAASIARKRAGRTGS